MKPQLAALALLVPVAFLGVLAVDWMRSEQAASTAALDPSQPAATADLDAAYEARMRALEGRIDDLNAELMRQALTIEALGGAARTPVEGAAVTLPAPEERDAMWFLAKYVESFRDGGEGAEYYRLGVSAHIPELVDPVVRLVATRSTTMLLRLRLTEILGDPRLLRQPKAVSCLLGLLPTRDDMSLVFAAVASITKVVDEASLPELERRVWAVQFQQPRIALVKLILELAGERANTSLAALLRGCPDAAIELGLVALIQPADVPGALDCFRIVSAREKPTRLAGAHRIHEFRDESVIAFLDEWAGRERDEEVRAVLLGARNQLTQVPSWAAEQATGEPNVEIITADSSAAWAPMQQNGGHEWIELDYDPMRATEVRVHEVLASGAVAKLILIEAGGRRHTVWQGQDPLTSPGVFSIPFDLTGYEVRTVRLELDTTRGDGWNEIDAVELVGPSGRAWAKKARASSYYHSGRTTNIDFSATRFFESADW